MFDDSRVSLVLSRSKREATRGARELARFSPPRPLIVIRAFANDVTGLCKISKRPSRVYRPTVPVTLRARALESIIYSRL